MKAGLMEIADIFVVNKADRSDADLFVRNLRLMLAPAFHSKEIPVPVIKTIAVQKTGIAELYEAIQTHISHHKNNDKKLWLLAEKAYYLIQQKRMADINKADLKNAIELAGSDFNLYQFIQQY
jgi:LAO/AO transport system kinase